MPEFIGRPRFFDQLADVLVNLAAEKYAPVQQGLQRVTQGAGMQAERTQGLADKATQRAQDMSDKVKLEGIKLISKALDEGRLDVLEKKGIDLNALLPGLMKTQELAPGISPKQLPGQGAFPQGLQPQPITTQMVPGILQGQTPATIRPISPLQQANLDLSKEKVATGEKKALEKGVKDEEKARIARQKEERTVIFQATSGARAKAGFETGEDYGTIKDEKKKAIYRTEVMRLVRAALPDRTQEEFNRIENELFPPIPPEKMKAAADIKRLVDSGQLDYEKGLEQLKRLGFED